MNFDIQEFLITIFASCNFRGVGLLMIGIGAIVAIRMRNKHGGTMRIGTFLVPIVTIPLGLLTILQTTGVITHTSSIAGGILQEQCNAVQTDDGSVDAIVVESGSMANSGSINQ